MDRVLLELIGKPTSGSAGPVAPRIITIVAENFSLLHDQSRFLKALLALPTEKKLPKMSKRLIQLGTLHSEIRAQLDNDEWTICEHCETPESAQDQDSICETIESDISKITCRSLLFVNDASRIQLMQRDKMELKRFLVMVDRWKRVANHTVIVLYQQSQPAPTDTFLRNLESISDASIRATSFKSCYLISAWYLPNPTIKSLIPLKVETDYSTCKIGKSFWLPDLLCFQDVRKVDKNFNPDLAGAPGALDAQNPVVDLNKSGIPVIKEEDDSEDTPESALQRLGLEAGSNEDQLDANPNPSTLPYIRAQNPEQSRIFYYPDKEDDVDEDDPDDDLGI